MAIGRRTRIVIVDDSAVMRSLLRSVVASDPSLEVAATAADGVTALSTIEQSRPDLVLLDIEMPVMDGLATLRELRKRGHRMPVIMCSSLTQRGARVTIEALASGASDYVAKPAGQSSREAAQRALSNDLLAKIRALTGLTERESGAILVSQAARPLGMAAPLEAPAVLVIGVSTGGPAALDQLLPALPESFPLPILIVQHMPEVFTGLFASRLNERCRLRVCEAAEGQAVQTGTAYVARGNWHMEVHAAALSRKPVTVHLTQGPPENHCRPAVDVLFRSAARVYGGCVLAVVLTGMGSDGLAGCRIIRERGGSVLAQDQATSTVWGMPGAVAQAGLAHKILPLASIASEIVRMASRAKAFSSTTMTSGSHHPNRMVV